MKTEHLVKLIREANARRSENLLPAAVDKIVATNRLPTAPAILGPRTLIDALRIEAAGYKALMTVLQAETDALCKMDSDALSVLTAAKLDHVSALHGLASTRAAHLAQAGWCGMNEALATLAAAPDGEIVRREWLALLALTAQVRALSQGNGRLIANQQRHFDVALQSLLTAAGVPPSYGVNRRPRRPTGRARAAA
jgi:flagellar biosynthesis/type III secretory pathway chaperone